MGKNCAAYGCTNRDEKEQLKGKVSFHRFPFKSGNDLVKKWVQQLKRKDFVPSPHAVVCSEHFEESCFTYQNFTNMRLLKPGSFPTKFVFSNPVKERKRTGSQLGNIVIASGKEENEPRSREVEVQTDPDILSCLLKEIQCLSAEKLELTRTVTQLKGQLTKTTFSVDNLLSKSSKNDDKISNHTGSLKIMASRKFLDSPDIKVEPDDLDTASSSSADSTQDNSVKSEQDWKTVPLSFPPQANVTYKDYNVEINGKKPRGVWDVIETEWFGEGVHRHRSNTTNMTAGTTPIDNHIPSVGRLRLPDELNDLNDNTSHENITEKGGNDDGGPIPVAMFVNTANSVNENRQHILSTDIPNQHLHTGDSLSLSQMATTNGDDNAYFPNAIADQGLEQDSFQQEEPMISTHPVKHEVNHKSDLSEYTRPSLLNSHLVALAFMNNKHRVCTAQDVYEFISTHFPYYQRANNDHWKSTVRHTLSAKRLSYMFHKLGRLTPTNSMINTNRGNYWQINDVELNKIVKGLKNWRERFKDNYYTSVAYPDYIDGLIDMFDSSLVSFLPSTSPSILATKLLSPLTTLSSSSTTSSSTQSSSSSLPSTSSSSSGPTIKNAFKSTKDGSSIVRKDKHKHKTKTKKRLKRAGKKVKRVG